jgi:hypothetical protein
MLCFCFLSFSYYLSFLRLSLISSFLQAQKKMVCCGVDICEERGTCGQKNINHLIENNECFKVDQVFRVQPNTKKCCFFLKKNYVGIFQ